MSVSVFVKGIREDADGGKLNSMARLKVLCDENGVSYPTELTDYFSFNEECLYRSTVEEITREAMESNLVYDLKIDGLVEGEAEYGEGMVIDLDKLPADIKKLRIYMS